MAGKPCGYLMGKLTTPQRVEWIRGLLIVYDMHDMHAPIQQDLIWKDGIVNNSSNTCQQ